MDLILWRHAEAEPGTPDAARQLTAKGQKQASRVGQWLDRQLPGQCRILSSPALRCVQTAEALGRKFRTDAALGTDSDALRLLQACGWPDARGVVVAVGHQPILGQVAAQIIGGQQADWSVRKANVFWIAQPSDQSGTCAIRLVIGPEMIGRLRA